jgi:hypothetical protein
MIDKLVSKINQWFNEPLGNTLPSDSAETELKRPQSFYENLKSQLSGTKGRGDKREPVKQIMEFHPRGAAGRREVRGPKGFSKAVMPRSGRRSTGAKKSK